MTAKTAKSRGTGSGHPARAPAPPPPRSAPLKPKDKWLPLLAGALALLFSWLAVLGALSLGELKIQRVFDFDTVRPWLVFRDIFQIGVDSLGDWRLGTAPNYIPDLALSWLFFALGFGAVKGMWLYMLAQLALAAAGWILVCDRMFGKSPARRAAVLLAHALSLLLLAWNGPSVFLLWMLSVYHSGTWALVPWALWLVLILLGADRQQGKKRAPAPLNPPALAGLFALATLSVASDLLFFLWFVAPALAALLCLFALGRVRQNKLIPLAAILTLSVPAGRVFHSMLGFAVHRDAGRAWNPQPENLLNIPAGFIRWFAGLVRDYPLEGMVCALFFALVVWRAAAVFFPSTAPAKIFPEPESPARLFVTLFIPASMAATVFGLYINGEALPGPIASPLDDMFYSHSHSYELPLVYFPLFVGWALLPWRPGFFRVRPARLALALSCAACLAAAPKALSIRSANLDPFNTPFYRCFADSAKRLGWKAGVANFVMLDMLAGESVHGVERILPVGILRGGAGRSRLYLDWIGSNRQNFSGDFHFVVVTAFNGRAFLRDLPRSDDDQGEPIPDNLAPHPLVFDDAVARGAFGDPAEIVECAGVGLYHYDPPLRFDFSGADNVDGAIVGRVF